MSQTGDLKIGFSSSNFQIKKKGGAHAPTPLKV